MVFNDCFENNQVAQIEVYIKECSECPKVSGLLLKLNAFLFFYFVKIVCRSVEMLPG